MCGFVFRSQPPPSSQLSSSIPPPAPSNPPNHTQKYLLTHPSGLISGESPTREKHNVPAIHHLPTNTHIIDSTPIAKFLEATYPTPPLPLTSSLDGTIELQARSVVGPTFRASVVPREINILSLRSQEYFRRTREAALGRKLEDCLMRRRRAGRLSVRE